jgi:hypothetical protein
MPNGMVEVDVATAEIYFEDIKQLSNYGFYSLVALTDGRIEGPAYGEFVSR